MLQKAFTVDEANSLVPSLSRLFQQIENKLEEVRKATGSLQVLDVLWGEKLEDPANPDFAEADSIRSEVVKNIAEIERLVETEIHGRGLRFPAGGLEHGLIDFPTTWEGRWVYLCWRRGEDSVQAWHEVDGGFAGRRQLTDDQVRTMGQDWVPGEPD